MTDSTREAVVVSVGKEVGEVDREGRGLCEVEGEGVGIVVTLGELDKAGEAEEDALAAGEEEGGLLSEPLLDTPGVRDREGEALALRDALGEEDTKGVTECEKVGVIELKEGVGRPVPLGTPTEALGVDAKEEVGWVEGVMAPVPVMALSVMEALGLGTMVKEVVPHPDALPPKNAVGLAPSVAEEEVVDKGEGVAFKTVGVGGEEVEGVKVGEGGVVGVTVGVAVGGWDTEEKSDIDAVPVKDTEGDPLGASTVADTEGVEERVGREDCESEGDLEEEGEKGEEAEVEGERVTLKGVEDGQGEELFEVGGEKDTEGDFEKELDPLGLRLVRPLRDPVRDWEPTADAEGDRVPPRELV